MRYTEVVSIIEKLAPKRSNRPYAAAYRIVGSNIEYTDGLFIVVFKEVLGIPEEYKDSVRDIKTGEVLSIKYPDCAQFQHNEYEVQPYLAAINLVATSKASDDMFLLGDRALSYKELSLKLDIPKGLAIIIKTLTDIKKHFKKDTIDEYSFDAKGMARIELSSCVTIYFAAIDLRYSITGKYLD